MKKRMYVKKAAAIGTAVVLACSMTACGTQETSKSGEGSGKEATSDKTDDKLLETMNRLTVSESTRSAVTDKEETVYVIADAEGTAKEVIVSEWLKNIEGSRMIEDVTNLTNIKNVKGDETYTSSSDGIVWESDGFDIYYQGTSDEKLPVAVEVCYYLDDKKVSPEELAGKSGHVRIRYDYVNNSSFKKTVDGKDTDVYIPFVMATGLMLPTDTFQNVTVSNGDVLSEGSHMLAFGIGIPGLSDSLGLEDDGKTELDIEVPEYFEVSADVEDFSLGMVVTLCSNTMIDFSEWNMDAGIDKLDAGMDKLTDGAAQLADGTSQLYDGTTTLKDGTSKLASGTDELNRGLKDYTSGVASAKDGATQLVDGSTGLDAGAQTLADKLTDAQSGSTQLKSGLETLNEKAPGLISGITSIQNGINSLLDGYEGSQEKVGAVDGANAVANGLAELNKQVSALSLPDMGSYSSKLTDEQKAAVEEQVQTYLTKDETGKAVLAQTTAAYAASVKTVMEQNGIQMDAQTSAVLEAVIKGTFEQAFINIYISAYESGMETGMEQVLTAVSGQLAGFVPQVSQLKDAVGQLAEGSASVASGVEALYEGTKKLDAGAGKMYDLAKGLPYGIHALYEGSLALDGGLGLLKDGVGTLKAGTAALKSGSSQLLNGCLTLDESSAKLMSGVGELKSGVSELNDGAGELQSGALELKDGVVQFNAEGIDKLAALVDGDLHSVAERIRAVSDVNADYRLYGGIADGKSGSEKFIIKIDGIEE